MKPREFTDVCASCGAGMINSKDPQLYFYKITVEQHVFDPGAITRARAQVEANGHGHVALAEALGLLDEPIAHGMGPLTFYLCGSCGIREGAIAIAHEKGKIT